MPRAFVLPQAAPAIRVRTLNHFGLAVSDTKTVRTSIGTCSACRFRVRAGNSTISCASERDRSSCRSRRGEGVPPSINHFCLGVEGFNIDRIMAALARARRRAGRCRGSHESRRDDARQERPTCCLAILTASSSSCRT